MTSNLDNQVTLTADIADDRFYLVQHESYRPEDLRSGTETRTIVIYDEPQLTNSSRQPRVSGWLGTTNDNNSHALGSATWGDAMAWLDQEGWIPVTAIPDWSGDQDDVDSDGDCRVYVPAHCALIEVCNTPGHDALDDWLYDCRSSVKGRLARGESSTIIADELEREAAGEGYRLVDVGRWLDEIVREIEREGGL